MHLNPSSNRTRARYVGSTLCPTGRPASMTSLSRDVGEVVYFARVSRDRLGDPHIPSTPWAKEYAPPAGDVLKIGHSYDLVNRLRQLGGVEGLLAFFKGDLDDELELHERFRDFRASSYGREWYAPQDEMFDLIDEIRFDYGLEPVERWYL